MRVLVPRVHYSIKFLKQKNPLETMSGSRDVEGGEFEAMEPDQLFARTAQIVGWIESALKRRDDVSRDIVHEMTSDSVADDGRYLCEKARQLDAREMHPRYRRGARSVRVA